MATIRTALGLTAVARAEHWSVAGAAAVAVDAAVCIGLLGPLHKHNIPAAAAAAAAVFCWFAAVAGQAAAAAIAALPETAAACRAAQGLTAETQ